MSEKKVDLSAYNNSWYSPGANAWSRLLWFYVSAIIFKSPLFPFSALKRFVLRLFGAKIGQGVVIKPGVNIKYPWNLQIDAHAWIGENVWIDNLALVRIGKSACLSQGAFLLTGNHDFTSSGFDLMVKPISLDDAVWIGAKAIVCPGVTCGTHAVLTAGSLAADNLEPFTINSGSPAVKIKDRVLTR